MIELNFLIELTSDAEISSGKGSDLVDSYIHRDINGVPYIPSSHIKGLMKANLRNIARNLKKEEEWEGLIQIVFGKDDDSRDANNYNEGIIHYSNAYLDTNNDNSIRDNYSCYIYRTAINPKTRVAKSTSLRRNEAVNTGLIFSGRLFVKVQTRDDLFYKTALLSLFSITSIGGNRRRGSGECVIRIVDHSERNKPPRLLDANNFLEIIKFISKKMESCRTYSDLRTRNKERVKNIPNISTYDNPGDSVVWKRIVFKPFDSFCCSEKPIVSNTLSSSFDIPASAVQGAILTKMSEYNRSFATKCFESNLFRTWPLMPVIDGYTQSTRVSLTHRIAKLIEYNTDHTDSEKGYIQDKAIEPYDWRKLPANSPLKASDGVLMRKIEDDRIELWESKYMPRVLSAHNGNNLFQVEAMSAKATSGQVSWEGVVALPDIMAEFLGIILKQEDYIAIGKGRSIRGFGKIFLEDYECKDMTQTNEIVLITQSPVLLPENGDTDSTDIKAQFIDMVSGWCKEYSLGSIAQDEQGEVRAWAAGGMRFGYNREKNNRRHVDRVILPGAVFCINTEEDFDKERFYRAILAGLGEGKNKGYGAVMVHPGKASSVYRDSPPVYQDKDSTDRVSLTKEILSIINNIDELPSPSQLSYVEKQLRFGKVDQLKDFLDSQSKRVGYMPARWKDIIHDLKELIDSYDAFILADGIKLLKRRISSSKNY